MGYRKIGNEVSVSELLEMREEGLTNNEIAERLDVSAAWVWKRIGAAGIRKPRVYTNPMVTAKAEDFAPQCAGLLSCGKDEHFIASGKKKITIHNGRTVDIVRMTEDGDEPIFMGLKREDVEALAGEMKAVLQLMGA